MKLKVFAFRKKNMQKFFYQNIFFWKMFGSCHFDRASNYQFSFEFFFLIFSAEIYLAHVIEKPNLRIPNPQYFLLFKWKFDDFFIHFEFDRGDKKTKCIHKSNVIKKIVVNIGDSEFVNLVFRWREQDIWHYNFCQNISIFWISPFNSTH